MSESPIEAGRQTSLVDEVLVPFLDTVASGEVAIGGGIAALTGAASAGLLVMVCTILLKRPGYADRAGEITPLLAGANDLRQQLVRLIDDDAQAYHRLLKTRQLPRRNPAERASRRSAIQVTVGRATTTLLQIAATCRDIRCLADQIERLGGGALFVDVRVARRLTSAALASVLDAAEQNLALMTIPARATAFAREIGALRSCLDDGRTEKSSILERPVATCAL